VCLGTRANFPSCSWLGWKYSEQAIPFSTSLYDIGYTFVALVHIYGYDKQSQLALLLGPRDDSHGVEGYCRESIREYNDLEALDPLPLTPSIGQNLSLFEGDGNVSQVLAFWTHVVGLSDFAHLHGRLHLHYNGPNYADFYRRSREGKFEIALVGINTYTKQYKCIIIERRHEFVRKIGETSYGEAEWISLKSWDELPLII
jgi:hypothetical protein